MFPPLLADSMMIKDILDFFKDHSIVNGYMFPMTRGEPFTPVPAMNSHLIYLPLRDTERIPVLHLKNKSSNITMVWWHGNCETLATCFPFFKLLSDKLGCNVIAAEYPGYGFATGKATERTVIEVVDTLLLWMENGLEKMALENVIVVGRSIGTGPACYMAEKLCQEQRLPATLLLISPFSSIKQLAIDSVGRIGNIVFERFPNSTRVKNIKCPTMIVHGDMDDVIFYKHSEKLYQDSQSVLKKFITLYGIGHNDIDIWNQVMIPFVAWFKVSINQM